MHNQSTRTLQTMRTSAAPAEVLRAAREFFAKGSSIYAAFVEKEGPNHLVMRGQGGEELVIAAFADGNATVVNGSTYMFDQQVARFLTTLAPAA
ncbi:MAG: hypothetical protein H3C62_09330 [Gemmatimonadaceae bacterium]|nr:hypothetical protein [Gemmatimonadaceae bacterium]